LNISVFGLGYVGCVSLGCLAKCRHSVIGVDLNEKKVDLFRQGNATIVEDEIDMIIAKEHTAGRITATTDPFYAVMNSDISLICVGTPSTSVGHLDLTAVFNVSEQIGLALRDKNTFHVVVIRSTVLPGTNQKVVDIIEKASRKKCGEDFSVVSNPEFLREGTAVRDFFKPPYTVVGSTNKRAIEMVYEMYQGIKAEFIVTDIKLAEMLKYVNNAFHASKVVFANEIGNICKKLEINSHELLDIFCKDEKLNISSYYLKPGFCYGGSCLPKDLKALKTIALDNYLECPNLESIEKSNENHKKIVLEQILNFNVRKIGFLGISFKAGTDDLRNSPIIDIIEILIGKGYQIKIFDKNVRLSNLLGANKEYIQKKIPFISKFIVSDENEIIDFSDLIVIVNSDTEYPDILSKVPNEKIIYDLVNITFANREKMPNYKGIAW